MNDVSWRRILQRAGDGFPDDGRIREKAPQRVPKNEQPGSRSKRAASPRDLEFDLQGALARAARDVHPAGPAQQQRPHNAPHAAPPSGQRLPVVKARVPVRRAAAAPSRRKGGARNVIAIALSTAVVGFAVHQVSLQWSNSRAGLMRATNAGNASTRTGDAEGRDAAVMPSGLAFQRVPAKPAESTPSATEEIPEAGVSAADTELHADIIQAEKVLQTARAAPGTDAVVSSATTNTAASVTRDAPVAAEGSADRRSVSPEEEHAWMERAMSHLRNGDIASARLFLEYLAKRGSATAAATLAKTYDRGFLASVGVKGMQTDEAEARKPYGRAADLGSRESETNLIGR
jgi:hypothetical protein